MGVCLLLFTAVCSYRPFQKHSDSHLQGTVEGVRPVLLLPDKPGLEWIYRHANPQTCVWSV